MLSHMCMPQYTSMMARVEGLRILHVKLKAGYVLALLGG